MTRPARIIGDDLPQYMITPPVLSPWREIGHGRIHQRATHPSGWGVSVIETPEGFVVKDGGAQIVATMKTVDEGKREMERLLAAEGFTIQQEAH